MKGGHQCQICKTRRAVELVTLCKLCAGAFREGRRFDPFYSPRSGESRRTIFGYRFFWFGGKWRLDKVEEVNEAKKERRNVSRRELVRMRDVEEMTYRQIGDYLGVSQVTAWRRIQDIPSEERRALIQELRHGDR